MKYLMGCAAAMVAMILCANVNDAGDKKPKHTTAEVMKVAMKGGLCKTVASGKATEAEKAQLVELFTSLAANTPPKGDAASWKAKTEALITAAKAGDGAALGKAANCAACHKVHK